MSVKVSNGLPANVVEIGNEVSQAIIDGLNGANPSASSSNPFVTVNGSAFLPLSGGTMSVGATSIFYPNTLPTYTEYGAWGMGLTKTATNQVNFFDADGLKIKTNNVGFEISSTQIKFPDNTTMSSAEQYLPLNRLSDFNFFTAGNWTASASGTVAQGQDGWFKRVINLNTLGYGAYFYQASYAGRIWGNGNYCTWGGVKTNISFRAIIQTNNNTTNDQIVRIGYGKVSNPLYTVGDLTTKGVGIRRIGQGNVELMVHDGTTFYTVTSTFNNGNNSSGFDAKISLDGLGKVDLYINGNIVATSNNAPLGTSIVFGNCLFLENQALSTLISPTVSTQFTVTQFNLSTI